MDDPKALKIQLGVRTKQLNDLQRYCAESLINKAEAESLRGVGINIYKRHVVDPRDFHKNQRKGNRVISESQIAEVKKGAFK